jgi:uncharacterized surface protein with fasciclin (FAS1) repeats
MKRLLAISYSILVISIIFFTAGCRDDEYYDRPKNLEPPIYQILETRGNFKSYLACVDKAGFKRILSSTGYMTVFAPTDSAFTIFLSKKGFDSVLQIDSSLAKDIVSYSILQDVYTRDKLDDYQSTSAEEVNIADIAFKRKTSYFKWIYTDTFNALPVKVIDANMVSEQSGTSSVNANDNNYKCIPYFTSPFLTTNQLPVSDYNYFFPEAEFKGFNVVDAKLIDGDLWAENGIVHIVDKVILPLPNIDEYLSSDPRFSMFRSIIDSYTKEYGFAPDAVLQSYKQVTGNFEQIYQKIYTGLVFAPNSENFLRYGGGESYDFQKDGWTLFAPTNEAIETFFKEKFLKFYSNNLENVPPFQVTEFINAHMFRTSVWPSKFNSTQNYFGEEARFDATTDVIDKKMCSNGIFYGVNKIQETDVFYTLLGDIGLNPDYSLMYQALQSIPTLYYLIKNRALDLQIILLNNEQLSAYVNYNYGTGTWEVTNSSLGTGSALAILERLMNLHIILNKNVDLTKRGFVETFGGEYIRYQFASANSGTYLYGPGNTSPRIKPYDTASNGIAYVINPITLPGDPITFNTENIGAEIESPSAFSEFYRYLQKSASSYSESDPAVTMNGFIYNLGTKEITGVKNTENTTVLIPSNTAMSQAVTDGYLPQITAASFTQAEQEKVQKFINYHILSKIVLVPDGVYNGQVATHHSTQDGPVYMNVVNIASTVSTQYGKLEFYDSQGRVAKYNSTGTAAPPTLSNRSIIIPIDNYLRYE